jgi:hypothetical protein
MAFAERTTKQVEKKVVVVEEVEIVKMELTMEEAQTLRWLVGLVIGPLNKDNSPRKHMDNIYYALDKAGVRLREGMKKLQVLPWLELKD